MQSYTSVGVRNVNRVESVSPFHFLIIEADWAVYVRRLLCNNGIGLNSIIWDHRQVSSWTDQYLASTSCMYSDMCVYARALVCLHARVCVCV